MEANDAFNRYVNVLSVLDLGCFRVAYFRELLEQRIKFIVGSHSLFCYFFSAMEEEKRS